MEAGVDRHGDEAGVPDGEQRLEVLGPVAHDDGHPVARRQARTRRAGRSRAAPCVAANAAQSAWTRSPSASAGAFGPAAAVALDPDGEVHPNAGRVGADSAARVDPPTTARCVGRCGSPGRGAGPAGRARSRDPVHRARRARRRRRTRRVRGRRGRLRGRARRPGQAEGVDAVAARAEPGGRPAGDAAGRALGCRATGRSCGGCAPSCAGSATRRRRVGALAARLAGRYPQYRDQPFARVLVLRIVDVTGWSAADS